MRARRDRSSHASQKESLEPIRQAGRAEKNAVGPPVFSKSNEDVFGIADLNYCFGAQSMFSQLVRCGLGQFPTMLAFFLVALFDRVSDGWNEFSHDGSFQWLIDDDDANFAFLRPIARGNLLKCRVPILRTIKSNDKPHRKIRLIDFSAGDAD